ncbi:protein NRT1/ PTR FAMILY 4.1-like [Tripterygium wilfordii]|uniref:protein NRT1/ PTR FAMILY 4.1-like n=1 Tax=Tripterygium wilfordii TaxID=458696 RepID=UPI0018F84220|nr:protein NRT1/ PTR FAMILY 4.1-like [Tripterygium wilfordii]
MRMKLHGREKPSEEETEPHSLYMPGRVWVTLENMAFVSSAVSLVLYFNDYMNLTIPESAVVLTNVMGTTFILTLLGGYISDIYLTRFKTCVLFGIIEMLVRPHLYVHFYHLKSR